MTAFPTFDGPAFARWLKRWKEAEGLSWSDVAERSGIAIGTIQLLARGTPSKQARDRGQTGLNPGIATIARLAHGLGLDFGFVASKAGLLGGGADRWENFNRAERALLARLLRFGIPLAQPTDRSLSDHLLQELAALDSPTLTEEVPA